MKRHLQNGLPGLTRGTVEMRKIDNLITQNGMGPKDPVDGLLERMYKD